jgi:glucuronate isomerase
VENGELPDDDALLGPLVENICYRNAVEYLRLPGVGV